MDVVSVRQYVHDRFPRAHATLVELRSHLQSGLTSNLNIVRQLAQFYPNSSQYWRYPEITYRCANNLPHQLRLIAELYGERGGDREPLNSTDFATHSEALELGSLLSAYGSDKANVHDYHLVYWYVLNQLGRDNLLHVIEIGLGTNDPVLVSTMGSAGNPGASLKAFRDYLPQSLVHGADIDRAILFVDERISTTWADQLDLDSLAHMRTRLGEASYDLIIDDGLHTIEANLNTLAFAAKSLTERGWCVVEDIPERSLPVWLLVQQHLDAADCSTVLVRARGGFMFVMTRNPSGMSRLKDVGTG